MQARMHYKLIIHNEYGILNLHLLLWVHVMKTDLKRQNFNITPEQESEIEHLKNTINASSAKDAILWAVHLLNILAHEVMLGGTICVEKKDGEKERVLIPELERSTGSEWTYLVARPHPWRRQLYVKGRKLPAYTVWTDIVTNNMSIQETADNWDLPIAAIEEITKYCKENLDLLKIEADEEKQRLMAQGVAV